MPWWIWAAPVGVCINCVVGAAVLDFVDHEDGRLFKWYKKSPHPVFSFLVLTLWPYVAWKFRHDNAKDF